MLYPHSGMNYTASSSRCQRTFCKERKKYENQDRNRLHGGYTEGDLRKTRHKRASAVDRSRRKRICRRRRCRSRDVLRASRNVRHDPDVLSGHERRLYRILRKNSLGRLYGSDTDLFELKRLGNISGGRAGKGTFLRGAPRRGGQTEDT